MILILENATGRDGYILCQALGYAIAAIGELPEDFQEGSNQADMEDLFAALLPDETARERYIRGARRVLRQQPHGEVEVRRG